MNVAIIKNAKITKTQLGINDRGVFTLSLCLDGDYWGVWWGSQFCLDGKPASPGGKREQTALPATLMVALFEALGVETWEEIPGTFVRVEYTGLGGTMTRIGHITKDRWVDIRAIIDAFVAKDGAQ
jgi:hypothetical protein